MADSLVVAASTFKPPINPRLRYEVGMRHRCSVPNNVKNWQAFEDDQQIKEIFTIAEEFQGIGIVVLRLLRSVLCVLISFGVFTSMICLYRRFEPYTVDHHQDR